MADKQVQEMTDGELLAEHDKWDRKVRYAPQWGAALAAADEFRQDTLAELRRRGLSPLD